MATEWRPAPGDLELVREFVNTLEIDGDVREEELGSPELLTRWLRKRRLLGPSSQLDDADLARAVELREALRGMLLSNNEIRVGTEPFETFDRLVRDAALSVRVASDGGTRLEPIGSGLDAAIGRFAAIVRESEIEGTWSRLKACSADDCQWAFYDSSRNRSGTWCDMSTCGNRAKVRAYRERGSRARRRAAG